MGVPRGGRSLGTRCPKMVEHPIYNMDILTFYVRLMVHRLQVIEAAIILGEKEVVHCVFGCCVYPLNEIARLT